MKKYIIFLFAISLFITSCEKAEPELTPTNELMEGVWELTEAYQNDTNIYNTVTSWGPALLQLDNTNSVNSTLGPLMFYIVYGKSGFINVTSKFDEMFSYSNLSLTEGEWFIDKNKVVDEFTVEMKLRFPSMQTFNSIFDLLNFNPPEVVADAMDIVVYHRFKNVYVSVTDDNPNVMVMEFDNYTVADYYTKDMYGDRVLYNPYVEQGVPVTNFSKCRLVFTKKIQTLNQLVDEKY